MIDLKNEEYIILELIPTSSNPNKGEIAQLSALKIKGINLIDRFDYRLNKNLINIPDILNMINYDNDSFTYSNSSKNILEEFKKFILDSPLLIMDNKYTENYLKDIKNKKDFIFKYLNIKEDDKCFDNLLVKYNLEPSNYLVDLLYEGLIKEL